MSCRCCSGLGSGFILARFRAAAVAGGRRRDPALGLAFALHRLPLACEAALGLALFCAGFALIGETTWERQAPTLQRRLGPVALTGRVVDVDSLDRGWRSRRRPRPAARVADPGRTAAPRAVAIARRATCIAPGEPGSPGAPHSIRCRHRSCRAAAISSASSTSPGSAGSATAMASAHRIAGAEDTSGGGWRAAAASAHPDVAADHRRAAGLDRRGRRGADHRQARRHLRRGQDRVPPIWAAAPVGDRRTASGPRWRLCLLRRARRPRHDSRFVALRYPIRKKIAAGGRTGGADRLSLCCRVRRSRPSAPLS